MLRWIDLSGYTSATLSFSDYGSYGAQDTFRVYVRAASGSTSTYVGSSAPTSTWTPRTFDLTPFVGNPAIRVEFDFYNGCGDCCGADWFIDNVLITAK